jgi:uncharacterized protein YabE (DUF348 family)
MQKKGFKLFLKFIFFTFIFLLAFFFVKSKMRFLFPPRELNFEDCPNKKITLSDNGLIFTLTTRAETVDNLLMEQKIHLAEHDIIFPQKESPLFSGSFVEIERAQKITISVDGKTIENYTLSHNISNVLSENNIYLNPLDKINPNKNGLVENDLEIKITRINIEEKVIPEDIPFKTTVNLDNTFGWREKKVQQAGVNGTVNVTYKITYKNGKEISRIIEKKEIIENPVIEIDVQGTFVKTGKTTSGQGSWYSFQGGLFAASRVIPRGSYARVTNTANGKSIMVQINDYGPQGKGRIIDLDKVAFQKIASLGAGIIGVKVEEVLN